MSDSEDTFDPLDELLSDDLEDSDDEEIDEVEKTGEVDTEDDIYTTKEDMPDSTPFPEDAKRQVNHFRDFKRQGHKRAQGKNKKPSNKGARKDFQEQNFMVEHPHMSEPIEEEYTPRTTPKKETPSKDTRTPQEKWNNEKPRQKRYRWVRDNGMLNGAEIEFFNNLGTTRRSVAQGDFDVSPLRTPVGIHETEQARNERIERITRAVGGRDAYRRNNKIRFNQKDKETLEFLALFRYATNHTLCQMFPEAQSTNYERLKKLRRQGLIIDKKIIGSEPIWFLTKAGMLLSGYDLPKVTDLRLTYNMFPHQFTVNHVATNLWGGNINVLNEKEYPVYNRQDNKGNPRTGDELVSEFLIQSSFGKLKVDEKSDVYIPMIHDRIEREFSQWEEAGGTEFGPSPEQMFGNEYMWVLFPPMAVRLNYHVPDLVVSRPRNADGTPNSIAVEVEIGNKTEASYHKTLQAYRHASDIYREVVWVIRRPTTARKLLKIAEEYGMLKSGQVRVIPIITEDGVFKGKDLWTL